MNTVNDTRSTLDKYMPLLIGLLVAFFAGKALKRAFWMFWIVFWVTRGTGGHLF